MTTIQKSIDVEVPVRAAYNQWTQFESFPAFMEGVRRVSQVTDTLTHWEAEIGGVNREFDAEITEQHPDERIAWKSVQGPRQAGVVTFHRISDRTTRVSLQMEFEPEGFTEKAGSALGIVERRIQGDLGRFKSFIESRGAETGAWRGEVDRPPQVGETRGPGSGGTQSSETLQPGGTSTRSVPPTTEGGTGLTPPGVSSPSGAADPGMTAPGPNVDPGRPYRNPATGEDPRAL